jgi:hypothetical protein
MCTRYSTTVHRYAASGYMIWIQIRQETVQVQIQQDPGTRSNMIRVPDPAGYRSKSRVSGFQIRQDPTLFWLVG